MKNIRIHNGGIALKSKFNENAKIGRFSINKYQLKADYNQDQYYELKNKRLFNLDSLLYRVALYRDPISIPRRKRVAKALVSALDDLSNNAALPAQKLKLQKRGIIKLKLIPGTYFPQFYRNSETRLVNQLELRHQLFIDEKYDKLLEQIHYEQDKKDAQYQRRIARRSKSNMR